MGKKITYFIPFILAIGATLWILHVPQPESEHTSDIGEMGLTIPQGYSIVPLELENNAAIANLVAQNGVVSIFEQKQNSPLIENLRIVKLSSGEGALFGALIPDLMVGQIQGRLSKNHLRAVLRPSKSGPTQIHLKPTHNYQTVQELTVEGDS